MSEQKLSLEKTTLVGQPVYSWWLTQGNKVVGSAYFDAATEMVEDCVKNGLVRLVSTPFKIESESVETMEMFLDAYAKTLTVKESDSS